MLDTWPWPSPFPPANWCSAVPLRSSSASWKLRDKCPSLSWDLRVTWRVGELVLVGLVCCGIDSLETLLLLASLLARPSGIFPLLSMLLNMFSLSAFMVAVSHTTSVPSSVAPMRQNPGLYCDLAVLVV